MTPSLPVFVSIIVAAVLVIFIIIGLHRGLLRMLFTTFSLVLVIAVAALLTAPMGSFLQHHTVIGTSINNSINEYIDSKIEEKTQEALASLIGQAQSQESGYDIPDEIMAHLEGLSPEEIAQYAAEMGYAAEASAQEAVDTDAVISAVTDEAIAEYIDSLVLPDFIKSLITDNNTPEEYETLGVTTFSEYVAAQLTGVATKAIAFVGLFVILFVLVKIISHLLGIISKIPLLHGINRFLGGVLGFAEGLLILWCICIFIMIFSGTAFGISCMQVIGSSKLLTWIYNSNILITTFS